MGTKNSALAVVLHDVSPTTWRECEILLNLVASIDPRAPTTLLVVPDFHRHGPMDRHEEWRAHIDARIAHGDELALHGYYHMDDAPRPTTPGEWLRRRFLTAGEGEFSTLNRAESTRRIELGLEMFHALGWTATGFVAPAWQMSTGCREALGKFPFAYTSTLQALYSLPDWQRYDARSMSFSSRSAVRRALSLAWNTGLYVAQRQAPLVRVALHPADALHRSTLAGWRRLLTRLLGERRTVTKAAWLREQRRPAVAEQTASEETPMADSSYNEASASLPSV